MQDPIVDFYTAQKTFGVIRVAVGALSVIIPIMFVMYQLRNKFFLGMLVALIVLGVPALITGKDQHEGADKIKGEAVEFYSTDPTGFRKDELPKIKEESSAVNKNLITYAFLLLAGMGLFFLQRHKRAWLAGIGLGLIILSTANLTFDFMARQRTQTYLTFLEQLPE